ncbi:cobalt transporter [Thermococcus argininiproducens]|uniref:Cobalt transporter n=1 Tax=Thermococcus argininiproducens TaxID=2866384 RepID=A0A9E7MA72_9EURY|nr:PDGLE domain-containing protein [Thermococcus argininiproducens]USG99749.1 cobalt transporter [Thermococcus argininiproducens]
MRLVIKGLLIVLILLALILPLASDNPDGLEATMEKLGLEESPIYSAPLDYGETWGQGLIMGTFGIILVFGAAYGIAKVVKGV